MPLNWPQWGLVTEQRHLATYVHPYERDLWRLASLFITSDTQERLIENEYIESVLPYWDKNTSEHLPFLPCTNAAQGVYV
jgi:hypothetical protein